MINGILIREANQDDLDSVVSLMERALSPFYPGNQYARAKNMFASVQGGIDYLVDTTPVQRVFIAEYFGRSAGFVRVVENRLVQSSVKIGPLIVSEEYREKLGIGSALLEYAEEFARGLGASRVYCTVAKPNQRALIFFLRKGFCVAGTAREQYKLGIEEVMLHKPLGEAKVSLSRVEVVPFGDWPHSDRVFELIASQMGEAFSGVDWRWIDELISESDLGLQSRCLFVAVSGSDVVGVVGVLPKDGLLTKIEPLVATYYESLEAILTYLQVGLMGVERKLYTHITPKSWQVDCMQRNGWQLEGIFPGDYADVDAIQQWGISFTDPLFQ